MITAILTMVVVWCLFFSRIPSTALALLCIGLGVMLTTFSKHKNTQFLTIDVLAQGSRLNKVNAALKFWTVLVLMAICVSARSPYVGLFLVVVVPILIVNIGGLKFHAYVHLLALPVSFLLISGLALLFEIALQPSGILNIHLFNIWLCVSEDAQIRAALVMSHALGAVSCLYLLSLTTPMSELIGVLRSVHCPNIVIELMYLIYRYIFVLLSMYHSMRDAAKSRLGFVDYRTSLRTTGNLYSNLLARSYLQASKNFEAMESRCYDMEIRFLENVKMVTGKHACFAICLAASAFAMSLLLR